MITAPGGQSNILGKNTAQARKNLKVLYLSFNERD